MNLQTEAREVDDLSTQLKQLDASLVREEEGLVKAEQRLEHAQKAQEVLQALAQVVQQKVHQQIAEVVSSCLEAVFDHPYQFRIEFERKRGKTEARLVFMRGDLAVDPLTAAGGGVVDVAAFALRTACLVMHRPRLSRVVVLDEPFRFVSAQYQENVRSMLESLAKDMGIQIVMVTHIEALVTGKVIEV